MDWIEGMKRLLLYIEEHLTDAELSVETAAQHAAYSPFYLQRIFYGLTDQPLSEYIRSRRMSLAGQELARPGREGDRRRAQVRLRDPRKLPKGIHPLPRHLAVGGQAPGGQAYVHGTPANQRNA